MFDGLPKPGDVLLGKYVLEDVLGEGGMGVVYAARHDLLGQRVAVKVVQPIFARHPEALRRFVNEARASAKIRSDHVARVLDVGMLDDRLPYMVLEFLEGEDLEKLAQKRRLAVSEVIDYVLEAIEGVAYAHALGIVHRDLKPSNLFLAKQQDGTLRVKVLDFGISKIVDDQQGSVTRTNSPLGSPLYMSPEQLRNAKGVGTRSDIWALGVILYQLLTGQMPFMGETAVELFVAIKESKPQPIRAFRSGDVSPQLDAVVMRCLEQNADDRFASVAQLAAALAPFGTAASHRRAENAARVLGAAIPPSQTSRPDVSAPPLVSSRSGHVDAVSSPSQTAGSWSDAKARDAAKTSRSSRWMLLALPAVGIVGGAAVWAHSNAQKTDARVAPASSVSTELATSASSPLPTISSASSSAVASASASASPSASAGAVASAAPSAAAQPPSKTSASHKPKTNCDPPYEFDASGKKHWKAECL